MDAATTRLQLENILKMQACVPDVLASIMGISGMSYDPVSGSGTLAMEEPGIRAVSRSEGVESMIAPLVDVCFEWARVRGHKLTAQDLASPARWLYGQLGWASANYAGFKDGQQVISEVHGKLGNVTGWGPDRSDRMCPHCMIDQQLKNLGANHVRIVRWPTDQGNPDLWSCPQCNRAWIITEHHDGLADSERALLAEQHVLMRQSEAARILGVDRRRIHKWIERGHLEVEGGKIYLDHAHHLTMRAQPIAA